MVIDRAGRRLAAVVGLAVLIAGCSSQSDSSALPPGAATPSPSVGPAAVGPAPVSPQPTAGTPSIRPSGGSSPTPAEPAEYCRLSELRVTAGRTQAATGHEGVPVHFTNVSHRSCDLSGYPGVAGMDEHGAQAAQAERTFSGFLGGFQHADVKEPPTVHLRPGQQGTAVVEGTSNPTGGARSCPDYRRLLVTPPGETRSTVVDARVPGCRGFQVHPILLGGAGRAEA
jgi:hypothetical protein